MRLFHEVPQEPLVMNTFSIAPILLLLFVELCGFLFHLIQDVLFPGVELVLAAGLQVQLVHSPVFKVIGECEHTHLIHNMELVCAVEIQD